MNVLFPRLHPGATLQLAIRFPRLLLAVTVSQTFLVFHDLDSFERTCQIFCRMSLSLSCFRCFSRLDWGFGCEVPFSPHCVRGTCYQHDLYRRCGPDHLVTMVSARFPHCKVTISLFPHFRSKSLSPAYPPFDKGFKLSSIPWWFHLFSPISSFYLLIPFIYQHKLMYTYFLF